MRQASLVAAAAVVLIANIITMVHVARNRSGSPESDVTLTQRELEEFYNPNDEDSGIALNLRWSDQRWPMPSPGSQLAWLDQKILQELGFDTSVAPSDKEAFEFYQRQRARRAFLALEFDGTSWRKWLDDVEHQRQAQASLRLYPPALNLPETSSRLMAIDASSDAARLRARHPERGSVVIIPAVIRIEVEPQGAKNPGRLYGLIQEIPSSIHVPLPFSDAFGHLPGGHNNAKYRVHLRYGAFLEPWIVGVDFAPAVTQ
jgi:hypothetical protein